MNSTQPSQQKDLFAVPPAGPGRIVLTLKRLQMPRTPDQVKQAKQTGREPEANFHIPSFKNSKRWLTKLPNGKPLRRPLLITSPEFQDWMEKAVASIESQLLSLCQTGEDGIQQVRSKLFAMCWSMPADDSVNDLPEGSWKVVRVPPGEEGASIVIERLN